MDPEFPQYRKYRNNKSYFKIIAVDQFEEIICVGNKVTVYLIMAKQYPEKLRIVDMMECKNRIWVEITAEEYEYKKGAV